MTIAKFLLLGPPVVHGEGRITVLKANHRVNLLFILLASQGQLVSYERLLMEIQPAAPASGSRNSVQAQVSRLRKDMVAWGVPPGEFSIRGHPHGYSMEGAPGSVDFLRFVQLAQSAVGLRGHEPRHALDLAQQALQLWRDPPYTGLNPGLEGSVLRARLETYHRQMVETTAQCRLALGEYCQALQELESAALREPFHEKYHLLLITALFLSGEPARGLRTYRGLCERLRGELGIEPSSEFQSAYTELLRRRG